ncbi:hypothetical protein STSP2_03258 [Anaerohalosphaera lusitana]|uniref:Uncharacterized protein n=1 Tax=Anaerohalosphaera lusitana TaxID=1936003 RepID=A0A1U9NR99_9BACT|nr:hypothetical protein [Anaerohalosphaera lusitana]AQT70056.1 hypothetical protein STSP2_03258 [Anaerohalosphaera lusitana]
MDRYIEVRARVRIPIEKIQDMIITAVEGGSNYWAKFQFPENYKDKFGSYEKIPFADENIEVFDIETGELLGVVNKEGIQKALQMMADCKDKRGRHVPERHFRNLAMDNEDAETADVFMQLAVMGEIVFG